MQLTFARLKHVVKLAFHDADTDILARIVARMSACRSACHRNKFRKSRVSDVSARILARMSVSASRNSSYNMQKSGEDRLCGFRVMRVDKPTNRQTDTTTFSSQYLAAANTNTRYMCRRARVGNSTPQSRIQASAEFCTFASCPASFITMFIIRKTIFTGYLNFVSDEE